MASEIVGELRRGSASVRRGEKGRLNITMQVDYLVVTDDKNTSREDVLLNTTNAPIIGLNYGPIGLPCVSKTATRNETNPLYWELSCEFDDAIENQESNPDDPTDRDPTTWIPIWTIDLSVEDAESRPWDHLNNFYANTAGELYDSPPPVKARLASWVFNQFEPASTSGLDILKRHMTVNSVGFTKKQRGVTTEYGQYSFLMSIEGAELGFYVGYLCWNIKYRLTFKRNMSWNQTIPGYDDIGWRTPIYSHGMNYLDSGVLKPWMENGINIDGPLTSTGGKGTLGSAGHRQLFLFYRPLDWSTFLR